jgi:predicted histone-like DNA-binding protein
MAKIFYLLKQNKVKDSKINGKWFAHGKTVEVMNTRKMASHISEHGSIYTPDVVFGVLEKFRSCLLEMLLNSRRVKIDGLGTFFTTIENEPGGAAKKEDFSPQKNLKALHIRFMPDQEAETNISSREFIKRAEFVNAESFASSLTDDEPSNGGSGSSSSSGSNQSGNSGSNTGGNTGGGNSDGGDDGDMN